MSRRLTVKTKLIASEPQIGTIILTGDVSNDFSVLDKVSDETLERIFTYNQTYNNNDYWLHRLNIYYPGLEPYLGLVSAATAYRRLKLLNINN